MIEDLRSALAALDALDALDADEYGSWINIGLALKTLGDVGLDLWLEFSASSEKFNRAEALARWGTFAPTNTSY